MCEMHVSISLVVFRHITPGYLLSIVPSWFANTLLANAAISDTWFKPRSLFYVVCKIIQHNVSKQNLRQSFVFMFKLGDFLVTSYVRQVVWFRSVVLIAVYNRIYFCCFKRYWAAVWKSPKIKMTFNNSAMCCLRYLLGCKRQIIMC